MASKVKSTFLVSAIIYHNVGSFSNDNSDSSKNVAMKKSGYFKVSCDHFILLKMSKYVSKILEVQRSQGLKPSLEGQRKKICCDMLLSPINLLIREFHFTVMQ